MLLWWCSELVWAAPRPVPLEEVVAAAARLDPVARMARAEAGARQGAALEARGVLDPVLGAHGLYTTAQDSGFLNGFPYTGSSDTLDFGVDVGVLLPIGTSVSLAAGLDRLSSRYTTDLGIGVSNVATTSWESVLDVTLTQPILRGAGLATTLQGVRVDAQRRDAAVRAAEAAEARAMAAAEAAYWEWVHAVHVAAIADEAVGVAAETLRMSGEWKAAGRISTAEHARYAAAEASARASASTAWARVRPAADRALAASGGMPGEDVTPVTAPPTVVHVPLDAAAAVARAVESGPDVASADARVASAQAAARASRLGVLPQVDIVAAGGLGALSPTAGGAVGALGGPDAFPYVTGGSVLSVPLGNRAARGQRDRADAELAMAEAARDGVAASVASEVSAAAASLASAEERTVLADAAVGYTAEVLAAEEALLAAGRALARDVLDARAAHAAARASAVRARVDHAVALATLRASGAIIP